MMHTLLSQAPTQKLCSNDEDEPMELFLTMSQAGVMDPSSQRGDRENAPRPLPLASSLPRGEQLSPYYPSRGTNVVEAQKAVSFFQGPSSSPQTSGSLLTTSGSLPATARQGDSPGSSAVHASISRLGESAGSTYLPAASLRGGSPFAKKLISQGATGNSPLLRNSATAYKGVTGSRMAGTDVKVTAPKHKEKKVMDDDDNDYDFQNEQERAVDPAEEKEESDTEDLGDSEEDEAVKSPSESKFVTPDVMGTKTERQTRRGSGNMTTKKKGFFAWNSNLELAFVEYAYRQLKPHKWKYHYETKHGLDRVVYTSPDNQMFSGNPAFFEWLCKNREDLVKAFWEHQWKARKNDTAAFGQSTDNIVLARAAPQSVAGDRVVKSLPKSLEIPCREFAYSKLKTENSSWKCKYTCELHGHEYTSPANQVFKGPEEFFKWVHAERKDLIKEFLRDRGCEGLDQALIESNKRSKTTARPLKEEEEQVEENVNDVDSMTEEKTASKDSRARAKKITVDPSTKIPMASSFASVKEEFIKDARNPAEIVAMIERLIEEDAHTLTKAVFTHPDLFEWKWVNSSSKFGYVYVCSSRDLTLHSSVDFLIWLYQNHPDLLNLNDVADCVPVYDARGRPRRNRVVKSDDVVHAGAAVVSTKMKSSKSAARHAPQIVVSSPVKLMRELNDDNSPVKLMRELNGDDSPGKLMRELNDDDCEALCNFAFLNQLRDEKWSYVYASLHTVYLKPDTLASEGVRGESKFKGELELGEWLATNRIALVNEFFEVNKGNERVERGGSKRGVSKSGDGNKQGCDDAGITKSNKREIDVNKTLATIAPAAAAALAKLEKAKVSDERSPKRHESTSPSKSTSSLEPKRLNLSSVASPQVIKAAASRVSMSSINPMPFAPVPQAKKVNINDVSSHSEQTSSSAMIDTLKKALCLPAAVEGLGLFYGKSFLFCGLEKRNQRVEITRHMPNSDAIIWMINQGGGKIISSILLDPSSPPCVNGSVFAVARPNAFRTDKYLAAIASGTPVIHYQWIVDSCAQRKLHDWALYAIPRSGLMFTKTDPKILSDDFFSSAIWQETTPFEARTLFKNVKLLFLGHDSSYFKNLAVFLGATLVLSGEPGQKLPFGTRIVVSSEDQDANLIRTCQDHTNSSRATVVSVEWLIQSMLRGVVLEDDSSDVFRLAWAYPAKHGKSFTPNSAVPDGMCLSTRMISAAGPSSERNPNNVMGLKCGNKRFEVGDFVAFRDFNVPHDFIIEEATEKDVEFGRISSIYFCQKSHRFRIRLKKLKKEKRMFEGHDSFIDLSAFVDCDADTVVCKILCVIVNDVDEATKFINARSGCVSTETIDWRDRVHIWIARKSRGEAAGGVTTSTSVTASPSISKPAAG